MQCREPHSNSNKHCALDWLKVVYVVSPFWTFQSYQHKQTKYEGALGIMLFESSWRIGVLCVVFSSQPVAATESMNTVVLAYWRFARRFFTAIFQGCNYIYWHFPGEHPKSYRLEQKNLRNGLLKIESGIQCAHCKLSQIVTADKLSVLFMSFSLALCFPYCWSSCQHVYFVTRVREGRLPATCMGRSGVITLFYVLIHAVDWFSRRVFKVKSFFFLFILLFFFGCRMTSDW